MKKILLISALALIGLTGKAQINYIAVQRGLPIIADTVNQKIKLIVPIQVFIYGDTNANRLTAYDQVICRFPNSYTNAQETPLIKDSIAAFIVKKYTFGTH